MLSHLLLEQECSVPPALMCHPSLPSSWLMVFLGASLTVGTAWLERKQHPSSQKVGSLLQNNNVDQSSSLASFCNVLNRLFWSLLSSQRVHTLRDMGVGPAALFLIKDAVLLGRQDAPGYGWYDLYKNPQQEVRNLLSLFWCGRLVAYTFMNWLLISANWVLFALSVMEPPQ